MIYLKPECLHIGKAFGCNPAGSSVAIHCLGTPGLGEALIEDRPVASFACIKNRKWQRNDRVQQIVQLMLVANVRPALASHLLDGALIELARFFKDTLGKRSSQGDGAGATFF